ncbi:helix-turn-helix transcriptional regulator [Paenibacillaceae bacterium WGS1546]|uniref:helix-turn-helix transcriptional regulator n=1 Tax=Cohnella sp. WGS1546 TaxID=3366810 RepID=UPI00372D7373
MPMTDAFELPSRLFSYVYKLEDAQRIVSVGEWLRPAASTYGLLLLEEAEGEGDVSIGGRSCPLRRNLVLFMPPGEAVRLSVRPPGRAEFYDVRFLALRPAPDGHYVRAELDWPEEGAAGRARMPFGLLGEIEKRRRTGDAWDEMKANILFQELLADLFRDEGREREPELNRAIRTTLEYMERNYAGCITRELLADIAGVSADYYSKAFKKRMNKSPMAYLNEIRIEQAKRLLAQSGESLRAIAQRVGYSDEFYFSRKFKAETGCSPKAYVRQIRKPPSRG